MKRLTSGVIIPTRNRLFDIVTCLRSLAQQTEAPDELIIVDASDLPIEQSREFQKLFCAACFPATKLQYIHTHERGAALQRNRGIGASTADILHFLDDDVVLESQYLVQMQKIFAIKPRYGGGMGTVTNISSQKKNFFWGVKRVFGLQQIYQSGKFTWSGMPLHAYGKAEFQEVKVLGGCCMAFRAPLCKKYLFDEKLGAYSYMEDADLSWQVSRHALLFYNPHARLAHMVSLQARDRVADTRALYIKNYSYLFFKNIYPTRRIKVLAYCWTILGLFVEALLLRNGAYVRGYGRGIWQLVRGK